MTRHSKRMLVQLPATVSVDGTDRVFTCATHDISANGLFLETEDDIEMAAELAISLLDFETGRDIDLRGIVVAVHNSPQRRGVGVRILPPTPPEWGGLVEHHLAQQPQRPSGQILRVLVVTDEPSGVERVFYATSGWDVRFATNVDEAREKLIDPDLLVVIAEFPAHDLRWRAVLGDARAHRPGVRRILRTSLDATEATPDQFAADALIALSSTPARIGLASDPLLHAVVDVNSGLEALLNAITASFAME